VKLTDILVTSVQRVVGNQAQGPLTFEKLEASTGAPGISEEVSLNFARIEWEYITQNPDGSPGEVIKGGWNLKENKTA
jgi:type VI protein secretion system component Hcp